jgi:hypothetical protein
MADIPAGWYPDPERRRPAPAGGTGAAGPSTREVAPAAIGTAEAPLLDTAEDRAAAEADVPAPVDAVGASLLVLSVLILAAPSARADGGGWPDPDRGGRPRR